MKMYPKTDKRTPEDVLEEIQIHQERRRRQAERDERSAQIIEAVLFAVAVAIYWMLLVHILK